MSTLHSLYISEIQQARATSLSRPDSVFSISNLAGLPEPVRRYLCVCGYAGTEKRLYGQIGWKDAQLKLAPAGRWHNIRCHQFNAVPEPVRIVHMKMRLAGIVPLEARDKFQGGHGNMLTRLLRCITMKDVRGAEMDASALVTVLAEALLLPAYALQPYVRWTAVAADRAVAELSWEGIHVHGIFFFNHRGEFVRFESGDRWRTEDKTAIHQTAWSIRLSDYVEGKEGIRYPTRATAAWHLGGEWIDYFRGTITGIGVMEKA